MSIWKNIAGLAALAKSGANDAAAKLSEFRARMDSWTNAMTGLNTSRDKTTYGLPQLSPVLPPQNLEAIYHDDDIAARMVSAMPDECFREPWSIISKSAAQEVNEYLKKNRGDLDTARKIAAKSMTDTQQERAAELQKALDEKNTREKHREAMTWGRLYGLGAIYLNVDDGLDSWDPIDEEAVRELHAATVLDKRDLTPWRWYANIDEDGFSDVAIYLVMPIGVYTGAPYVAEDILATNQVKLVHESRMIRYGGELTSKRLRLANQSADYSVLQKAFRALQLFNENWQSSSVMMSDASQGVLYIRGLIDMIAQQPDVMTQRFQFMDLARSVMRSLVLDAGDASGPAEKFERVPSRFEGIPQMLEQSYTRISAAARMPKVILFGSSTKGLGDTGDSELRWWYDTVRATQETAVKPNVEKQLRLEATARGYDDADDYTVVFASLWQMTQLEEAQRNQAQAQADTAYSEAGWITPEEGALSRWGSGKYSLDTKIDVESRKRSMQFTLEAMQQQAQNEQAAAKDPEPTPGDKHQQQQELQTQEPPKVVET
jgi:phage-related protein (TIGR01555 family)